MAKSRGELIASDRQYRDLKPEEHVDYVCEQAALLYIAQMGAVMTPELYCSAMQLASETETVRNLRHALEAISTEDAGPPG